MEKTAQNPKRQRIWDDEETNLLLYKHDKYIEELGLRKRFRVKKQMWEQIALEIPGKTAKNCEERYKCVMKRKNKPVSSFYTPKSELEDESEEMQHMIVPEQNCSMPIPMHMVKRNYVENDVSEDDSDDDEEECCNDEPSVLKGNKIWTDEETNLLLKYYKECIGQVGLMGRFSKKKQMWQHIGSKFPGKKWQQCEDRFKTVIRRNRRNQAKMFTKSTQDPLEVINALEDSTRVDAESISEFDIFKKEQDEIKSLRRQDRHTKKMMELALRKEENKERRHQERMKAIEKVYDLLQKIVEKNNK